MVAHHVVTGGICVAICYPFLLGAAQVQPWGQFDTVYFFGLTEVSTLPLAVHDTLKHLPRHLSASKLLTDVDEVCKAIFPSLRIRVGPPQNLKVVVKGDMAYATYKSNERIGDGPPMMVRRTEIFVRKNKEWLLTHSHRSILQGE